MNPTILMFIVFDVHLVLYIDINIELFNKVVSIRRCKLTDLLVIVNSIASVASNLSLFVMFFQTV